VEIQEVETQELFEETVEEDGHHEVTALSLNGSDMDNASLIVNPGSSIQIMDDTGVSEGFQTQSIEFSYIVDDQDQEIEQIEVAEVEVENSGENGFTEVELVNSQAETEDLDPDDVVQFESGPGDSEDVPAGTEDQDIHFMATQVVGQTEYVVVETEYEYVEVQDTKASESGEIPNYSLNETRVVMDSQPEPNTEERDFQQQNSEIEPMEIEENSDVSAENNSLVLPPEESNTQVIAPNPSTSAEVEVDEESSFENDTFEFERIEAEMKELFHDSQSEEEEEEERTNNNSALPAEVTSSPVKTPVIGDRSRRSSARNTSATGSSHPLTPISVTKRPTKASIKSSPIAEAEEDDDFEVSFRFKLLYLMFTGLGFTFCICIVLYFAFSYEQIEFTADKVVSSTPAPARRPTRLHRRSSASILPLANKTLPILEADNEDEDEESSHVSLD